MILQWVSYLQLIWEIWVLMFCSMVNDYFSQVVMDFFFGNVIVNVFEEFEVDMMIKDLVVFMV